MQEFVFLILLQITVSSCGNGAPGGLIGNKDPVEQTQRPIPFFTITYVTLTPRRLSRAGSLRS